MDTEMISELEKRVEKFVAERHTHPTPWDQLDGTSALMVMKRVADENRGKHGAGPPEEYEKLLALLHEAIHENNAKRAVCLATIIALDLFTPLIDKEFKRVAAKTPKDRQRRAKAEAKAQRARQLWKETPNKQVRGRMTTYRDIAKKLFEEFHEKVSAATVRGYLAGHTADG